MQITITKTTKTQETIDIQLPYYYKHDLMLDDGDFVIYGKIDEQHVTAVKLARSNDRASAEIEKTHTDWHSLSNYLTDEYKGTQQEYDEAKAKALALIQSA